MTCEFSRDDGAYVLGALSPSERSAYQAHLSGCAECTRAVQELAGLPGLLGRVPADVLESPEGRPLPDTLLPALVREAQRSRRRRTRLAIGAAAAAAVIVAVGSLAIGLAVGDDGAGTALPPSQTTAPTGQPMEPVGPEVMSANLALTSVAWGTRLDLTCSYPAPPTEWGEPGEWAYVMVVRTRDGKVEQVATWRALPGKTMRLAAATATSRGDIRSVEIRSAAGEPLLTLVA